MLCAGIVVSKLSLDRFWLFSQFFFAITRRNLRIMHMIPFRVDAYSLAHNYQIRENIRTLKVGDFMVSSRSIPVECVQVQQKLLINFETFGPQFSLAKRCTFQLIGTFLKAAGLLNCIAALLFSLFEYTSGLISRLAFAMFDMWVAMWVPPLLFHRYSGKYKLLWWWKTIDFHSESQLCTS